MLFDKILEEYQRLQNQIEELQKKIRMLPDGTLICARGSNCYKWYQTDGHTKKYICKSNRPLAQQLAVKKYLSLTRNALIRERTALEFYLRHHASLPDEANDLLTSHPGYRELLLPYFKPKSEKQLQWMNEPFDRNRNHPEHLIHQTSNGILVRSKSESMISHCLHTHSIPFRYECALQLGTVTIYPDFTIMHPETEKIFYWEHFGKIDDPQYSQNACAKLHLYITNGIIPSLQLITSYETREAPLSYQMIERIITHYFL